MSTVTIMNHYPCTFLHSLVLSPTAPFDIRIQMKPSDGKRNAGSKELPRLAVPMAFGTALNINKASKSSVSLTSKKLWVTCISTKIVFQCFPGVTWRGNK